MTGWLGQLTQNSVSSQWDAPVYQAHYTTLTRIIQEQRATRPDFKAST